MQDQPNYLGRFAESEQADAKFAALIEQAVKKQLEPLLERLEEIEKALKRNE